MKGVKTEKKPLPLHSPDQTQEETLELETPKDMKCDACVGVSTMYAAALLKHEMKTGKRKRLSETSYLEVMETTCADTPWAETFGVVPGYGGRNYLMGPGLQEPPLDDNSEQVNAVVTRRGGFWDHRFKTQCMERGGLDEDEVYEAHWAGDGTGEGIAKVMCRGKKQACGKYPSPRDIIPKDKWPREGGVQLPEDELDVPEDPAYYNPHTGREDTFKPHSDKPGRQQDL